MNFHVATAFLTSFIVPAQGIFVLTKNPRQSVNRAWCALSISVGLWSFGYAMMIASSEYTRALFWARIAESNGCIIPTFFLHFTYALLQTSNHQRTVKLFYFIGGFLASLTLLTPLIVVSVKPKMGFLYYTHLGSLAWIYTFFFFATVILAHVKLWQGIGISHGTKKNQLLYVFIAGVLGFGTGSTTFPISFGFPAPDIGNLVFLYTFPITYAILKHKLMDITVIIRRTLVYSALTAVLTSSYFIFILLTERWFQTLVGYRSFLITTAAAFLLAISFIPLKNWIQAFVDRFFFRGSLPQVAEERSHLRQELIRTDQLRAVGTFAAGMAHEIKNPLATLQTFVEHLPTKYNDPSFRERFARLIPKEVAKIDRIVQEVLAFAKPASPTFKDADLQALTEEVLEFLNGRMVKQRIQVEREYQDGGACRVDPVQMKQVILNLIMNSLDAMPLGGTLTVGLTRTNERVALSLRDTGSGISPDLLPKIGSPFVTTKDGGTGLGLAIVQSILEAHGGRLELQSFVGAGTIASVWLPTTDTSKKG